MKSRAAALLDALGTDDAIHAALAQAGAEALSQLARGIARFQQAPYIRPEPDYIPLWREGSSTLYEQPATSRKKRPTILFVPSLINRAYIFDLTPETSAMRIMSAEGFRCLLMDWSDPGAVEKDYGIEDYILRLERALDTLDGPVILAGYCMGGMMALALAQRQPEKVRGLALLATPWDFHSPDVPHLPGRELYAETFGEYLRTSSIVPGEMVYQLLYSANPWPVHDKFVRFAGMAAGSREERAFIEREHWVQDSVDLSAGVARHCFIEWPVHNTPANGAWKVAENIVRPEEITVPAFVAIAQADAIVPQQCAGALSRKLPNAWTIYPPSGHVGMVAGSRAKEHLWLPLAKWARGL